MQHHAKLNQYPVSVVFSFSRNHVSSVATLLCVFCCVPCFIAPGAVLVYELRHCEREGWEGQRGKWSENSIWRVGRVGLFVLENESCGTAKNSWDKRDIWSFNTEPALLFYFYFFLALKYLCGQIVPLLSQDFQYKQEKVWLWGSDGRQRERQEKWEEN